MFVITAKELMRKKQAYYVSVLSFLMYLLIIFSREHCCGVFQNSNYCIYV